MIRAIVLTGALGFFTVSAPSTPAAVATDDTEAIEAAALDYIEGFYTGDADRLRRSVRPEVTKYGFARRSADQPYQGSAMPFEEMLAYAEHVRTSGDTAPADAPKEVEILDAMDQIAVVKVTAFWGSDYLQMAKYEGRWMILHVIWQTPSAD
ncbi:MAG: nuclear transport factor 2 family protein [Gemmatimonadota bacterium]|nr:nuclear transport factor 2 family protein [Gemmatimonadota bacterium]